MAKVNICMAVRDRLELTRQCVQSLVNHTNSTLYNLTVVDDGSDRETAEWLLDHFHDVSGLLDHHVLYNYEPLGVGGAKSLCAYASEIRWGRGDFLYFTDNDMYFEEEWLERMIVDYESLKVGHPRWGGGKPLVLGGYNNPFQAPTDTLGAEFSEYEVRYFDALGGASMMMTWDTWDQFGPFAYNARGVRQSEDVDFGNRVRKAGGKLAALWPHVVHDCGKTDTFGVKVPYADAMPEVEGAKVL